MHPSSIDLTLTSAPRIFEGSRQLCRHMRRCTVEQSYVTKFNALPRLAPCVIVHLTFAEFPASRQILGRKINNLPSIHTVRASTFSSRSVKTSVSPLAPRSRLSFYSRKLPPRLNYRRLVVRATGVQRDPTQENNKCDSSLTSADDRRR